MEFLIPIFTQFLVGWLAQCNSGGEQVSAHDAIRHNCDEDVDPNTGIATRTFDDDFVTAGVIRAKRAVRRLHRGDRSQPKRRSPEELRAMVVGQFNKILDTPEHEVRAVCSAIVPMFE